ncbi:CAP domain-containing protein [Streptomyces sp. IMTB 2501]|uniref:CAP domain-containing protein n=1 Tax=Streptomyces sp. IMTB 2501 TaxID=1776340 RepID=UPI0009A1CA70
MPPGRDAYPHVPAPRQDSYGGGRAPRGIAPYLNPEIHPASTGLQPLAYARETAKAHAYLFAAEDGGPAGFGGGPGGPGGGGFTPDGAPSPGRRRRRKGSKPVRTGLIGVSAAFALGTAAVASGVVPGLQNYKLGGDSHTTGGDTVQAVDTPSNTAVEQGGTSGSADRQEGGVGTGQDTATPESPSQTASASNTESASPTPAPSKTASEKPTPSSASSGKARSTPSRTTGSASTTPRAGSAPMAVPAANAAEAEVLGLVNQERAKVGCTPLAANSALTKLAESFSDDMAARGFFDHTDPDGKSPWDRAAAAGITNLGGENIARGQADAAAVMQAWMNSPGHKANILNCDFKTLGVGVHLGPGGPWWTQDFGY